MTIDQRAGALWRKIPAPSKAAFLSCLTAGYLIHLYAFTNLIPNSDGLSRVYDLQQMTVSGRWFLHFASALTGFTQMPAAAGLLSLVLLSLAAALIVDTLALRSALLSGLAGAVMAAFPCLGYTFLYLFTAPAYCLAILLAVLSVRLARKGKTGWLWGALALALSMGIYQAYAAVAVSLSLLLVLKETLDPDSGFQKTLRLGLRLASFLALGAVLYYVILLVFLRVKDLELLSYLGMDEAGSGYPVRELPRLIFSAYKQAVAFFFVPSSAHSFANRAMAAWNLIAALEGGYCLLALRKGKEPWRIAGALAMLALLPLGIGFGQVISPFSDATPIMKYAYVCVYLALLLLADRTDRKHWARWNALGAAAWAAVLLVLFLNTNNLLYTASAQAHRATESYLTRLWARVEACPGYEPGMEVVIVGAIPENALKAQIPSYARIDHYSVPMSSVAPLNKHIYYYLRDWLNIPVEEPAEETMTAVSDSGGFQDMPLYPAAGSVRELDGRIVVKLRKEYTPKSDFELAYERRR